MTKYLLFDYGGVLVDLDRARALAAFDRLGFDIRPFLGSFGQKGPFCDLETGRIDEHELCSILRTATEGRETITDESFIEAWRAFLTGVPKERLETVLRARRHYRTFLLSNTSRVHWLMADEGFFCYEGHTTADFFEQVFLSYRLGCQKPDAAIFQAVLSATGLPAEDFLFLDDSEANCEAARRVGFRACIAPASGAWMDYFDDEGRLCI